VLSGAMLKDAGLGFCSRSLSRRREAVAEITAAALPHRDPIERWLDQHGALLLRLAFVAIFIITPHQEPGARNGPVSALVPKRVASARKSHKVKVLDWWSQAESNPDLLNAIQARYLSSPECRRDRHPRFPSRSFDLLGCPHGSGSSMSAATMLTLGSRTSLARSPCA
jgi:hypothetical protein